MSEKLIPLVDLTDGDDKQNILAAGRPRAFRAIEEADQFLVLALGAPNAEGNPSVTAVIAADDTAILNMAGVIMTILGAAKMGPALESMPAQMGQATAQLVGFNILSDFVRQCTEQHTANEEPATPASDIGATAG